MGGRKVQEKKNIIDEMSGGVVCAEDEQFEEEKDLLAKEIAGLKPYK